MQPVKAGIHFLKIGTDKRPTTVQAYGNCYPASNPF